jgi:uncharacterized membrane protein YphA (DoxX/SURF4 family)
MSEVAYVGALALAVVFAWAGVAKLRTPAATAATFRALRLPAHGVLARTVPLAELALAALLVAAPRFGGPVAVVLLGGFTLLLARRLGRGETVSCGCFGSARQAPIAATDLVRNGLLIGLAVAVAVLAAPAVPGLSALVAGTAAIAIGAVALALVDVRVTTGRLLDNSVPTGPEGLA